MYVLGRHPVVVLWPQSIIARRSLVGDCIIAHAPCSTSNTRSTNSSATALIPLQIFAGMLHLKHLQHFVAIMVDDFHGDLAGFGLGERATYRTVETAPGGFVYVRP